VCQGLTGPTHDGQDEWFLDTPALRTFIGEVQRVRVEESDPARVVELIEPAFKALLADQTWLPDHFAEPSPESGMGSGIGMWLLFRAGDGNLALSSLVVPPGAATPVHDHLAWGLVGLYRGTQDEVVFTRTDDASVEDKATLETMVQRSLEPGDLYEILPETDIHKVQTTSDVTSVSLHLLGNDNGCKIRHRFHPNEGRVEPFKSGWLNVPCADSVAVGSSQGMG
jgi:predicted metal-dependent enzyme (double-stranded beta helix superfamily)